MSAPLLVSLPDSDWAARLGPLEGVRLLVWDLTGPAPAPHLDLVMPPLGRPERLAALAGLTTGLVQGGTLGWEAVPAHLPPGHRYANARGTHEIATAELALALTLAAQRDLPGFQRAQASGHWERRLAPGLADARVLLIGQGGLGQAIAARLAPFEVQLTRLASRARVEGGHAILGPESLHSALARSDIVIVSASLTEGSRGLLDAAALAALPDGALVVNVGRGPIIEAGALERELHSGRLRAALDVTDPEPLPPESPLWQLPNVILTPHVGGHSAAQFPRLVALLLRQIGHLQAGRAPENIVVERR